MSNNTNDELTWYGLGALIVGGIIYAIVMQFKTFFGVDADTAVQVIIRLVFFILGYGIIVYFTRRFFEVTLIAIPLSYLWLYPVIEYHAIQTYPNVPFPLTWPGQALALIAISALCFGIWFFKNHVWKEIWA
ncbi:hypothetical protein [Acinetobacter pittii]|uniref:hypothetical protein n=1 Tax=Acinetobacter pittii TaxID=48296 RepID=UPI001D082BDB|nr:hypothetical protein [Acinetobacter pittii]